MAGENRSPGRKVVDDVFAVSSADTGVADYLAQLVDQAVKEAFIEGRDSALDNAAMKAHDMGRPDIRWEINHLVDPPRGDASESRPPTPETGKEIGQAVISIVKAHFADSDPDSFLYRLEAAVGRRRDLLIKKTD